MRMAVGVVTKTLLIATAHDVVLLCRELIDEGVQAVQPLKGKKLLGAIYGQQCISNTTNRVAMEKFCKQHSIAIWLLNGDAVFIGVGDSCTNSPSFKPCRPQAMLQYKPHRRQPHRWQPHIYACHQPCRQPRGIAYLEAYAVDSDLLQPRFLDMFLHCSCLTHEHTFCL